MCLLLFLIFIGELFHQHQPYTHEDEVVRWILSKNPKLNYDTAKYIYSSALEYEHKLLLLAIAQVESNFDLKARNKKNHGLMQINEVNVKHLVKKKFINNKQDLYDVKKSMKCADYILSKEKLIDKKLIRYKGKKCNKYISKVKKNYEELCILDKKRRTKK